MIKWLRGLLRRSRYGIDPVMQAHLVAAVETVAQRIEAEIESSQESKHDDE